MKQLVVTRVIALAILTSSVLVLLPAAARADHRPNAYCSSSGDICQSTRRIDGVRRLTILMSAKYFSVFHLCVLGPDGHQLCAPFRVRERSDGLYGRSVIWSRHFSDAGEGAYRVSWWVTDQRIGKKLGFHVR